MTYTLPHVTDAPIIAVDGAIGPATVIALQRRVVRALDTGHRRIVLDLGEVTALGGQTLSLFCGALRFVSRCGASLAIVGTPADVRRVVELCELRDVEFHTDVHAALTAMTSSASLPMDINHTRRESATTKGLRQHA